MKKLLALCLLLAVFLSACATGNAVGNEGVIANADMLEEAISEDVTVAEVITAEDITAEDTEEEDISVSLANAAAADVIEIKEKMFITQINDIELNARSYEGKTIKVEGMYFGYFDSYSDRDYNYVQRRSPGCCGNDGVVGFEIFYDGDMPAENDWIEVLGKIEIRMVGNNERVVLRADQVTIKDERGKEFVIN